MRDGLRLAVGTLTIFPVPAPRRVDRDSGAWAMTLAPVVALLLSVIAGAVLWLLGWAPPLVASALTIGALAVLTRGMHLDGLADTVDGLGSGRPAEEALAIMRKSDIGPFGVVALVLTLMVQVVALAALLPLGRGPFAVACALVVSRLVLPVVCSRGIPAARPDGLGQVVAGTVSRSQLLLSVVLAVIALAVFAAVTSGLDPEVARSVVLTGASAVVALAAGALACWRCVRRLGGVTGDVLGACTEITFTVVLVVLTMASRTAAW